MGPAGERGTIIRRLAERALRVTASLKEARLPQRDACGANSGTDEQPHRDAKGRTV